MIYDGGKEIASVKDGNKEVIAVYDGPKEVWSLGKAFYLGFGATFNVKSLYKDYQKLTADDFFIRLDSKSLVDSSYSCGCWDGSSCNGCCRDFSDAVSFSKSYNNTTGEFKCNYGGHAVYAYLIPNSNTMISKGKIVNLGSKTSWTITQKDKAKCTKNNFLFRTLPYKDSYYICCSYNCENWISFSQSYNASTGVLTASVSARRTSHQGDNVNPFYISTSLIK